VIAAGALGVGTQAASAASGAGGMSSHERPVVQQAVCVDNGSTRCSGGELLKLRGEALADVQLVIFRGRSGRQDDQVATPEAASPHRVVVQVPASAQSGLVQVRSKLAGVSRRGPRLRILPLPVAPALVAAGTGTFPIAGAHKFGTAPANVFQGPGGHMGQDVFAACGTPLVAARAGTVQKVDYQSRAGNYVVIDLPDGRSEAYMHLREPAIVAEGQAVGAGQPIGEVGDTGDAVGCHLHFELWTAPGWYEGGEAVDPLPELKSLPGA
jgi:murein DD-endopeptidase MepM/ murein hydrolase activator NlpD